MRTCDRNISITKIRVPRIQLRVHLSKEKASVRKLHLPSSKVLVLVPALPGAARAYVPTCRSALPLPQSPREISSFAVCCAATCRPCATYWRGGASDTCCLLRERSETYETEIPDPTRECAMRGDVFAGTSVTARPSTNWTAIPTARSTRHESQVPPCSVTFFSPGDRASIKPHRVLACGRLSILCVRVRKRTRSGASSAILHPHP